MHEICHFTCRYTCCLLSCYRLCSTNPKLLVSSVSQDSHQGKKDVFIMSNSIGLVISDGTDGRVPVLMRPKLFACNLPHRMLKRISPDEPTVPYILNLVSLPLPTDLHGHSQAWYQLSGLSGQQGTWFWKLSTPGQLALTIPISDCKAYKYKPLIPNHCKCVLTFPLARFPKGLSPTTALNREERWQGDLGWKERVLSTLYG